MSILKMDYTMYALNFEYLSYVIILKFMILYLIKGEYFMQRLFTSEEIIILRNNPFTLNVTPRTINFTLTFKQKFLELYNKGLGAKQIIKELGYDPTILGQGRIDAISRHIKLEAKSKYGLHEGSKARGSRANDLQNKVLNEKQTIDCLKQEVILLRQELDLLKKIINAETRK